MIEEKQHFCYVLINATMRNTYVGYTVSPTKRIRQHNCEIKGGARYTKRHGPDWSFVLVLTSPTFDSHRGLSFEWHMKAHGRKKNVTQSNLLVASPRRDQIQIRIDLLQKALSHSKFVDVPFTMYVAKDYIDRVTVAMTLFPNVSIKSELELIFCQPGLQTPETTPCCASVENDACIINSRDNENDPDGSVMDEMESIEEPTLSSITEWNTFSVCYSPPSR